MINCEATEPGNDTSSINRRSFPEGFIFGTASSAYQYEGGVNEGGRGPSIWDTFSHINGGAKIEDKSNGDVAADSYHRYKEDVALMKETGFDAYRFSISWTRILKNGRLSGGVNEEGISYYNNLIDELLAKGIRPFVTLFHWDLPQSLQDEYGGFLSPKIVDDFRDYAEICFKNYGDRVKDWITLNEPWSVSIQGYLEGRHAPGYSSVGDKGREVYMVSHNQLLAHAAAAHLYKEKYQATQKGKIGISLISHWFKPFTNSEEDQKARDRALDFMLGWFLKPLTKGNYPKSMRSLVADRLPKFSRGQSEMLKGSFDFIGLNYYTADHTKATAKVSEENYYKDSQADIVFDAPVGPKVGKWIKLYPNGLQDLLLYVKEKYNNPLVYITENGVDQYNISSRKQTLADNMRIDYHYKHLFYIQNAIKNGANVKGYFAWSLLDNFEWSDGYTSRYGIFYVDFQNGLKRYPKDSAHWFKKFLRK